TPAARGAHRRPRPDSVLTPPVAGQREPAPPPVHPVGGLPCCGGACSSSRLRIGRRSAACVGGRCNARPCDGHRRHRRPGPPTATSLPAAPPSRPPAPGSLLGAAGSPRTALW